MVIGEIMRGSKIFGRVGVSRANGRGYYLPLLLCAFANVSAMSVHAEPDGQVRSRADLEYGAVLFEYYQQDYFNGLIEHAYTAAIDNPRTQGHREQLLKGSMALSYAMPDEAQKIFDRVLTAESDADVRNRAWYYLAKLYHSRSKPAEAFAALENVRGRVPADLHLDYHYLATLINNDSQHLQRVQDAVERMPAGDSQYPYLLFNLGVSYLTSGDQEAAVRNLTTVVDYADRSQDLQVLADRARHGLAQISIQEQQLEEAWSQLQHIRTEGLYSNRALLAYAWTAIRQELLQTALPALQLLNDRSIALPEAQESKVLLGHVYEQQGFMSRALKSHIRAEQAFNEGLQQLANARDIVREGQLPQEFIANLDATVDTSDWEGVEHSNDYTTLAPFLVDLMASNAFHLVHKDLSELYAIRDNLRYWARQTDQHKLILQNADEKVFDEKMRQVIQESARLHERLADQRKELELLSLTLGVETQVRFRALFENASREMAVLDDKVRNLRRQSEPYRQPPAYEMMVAQHHPRIGARLEEAESYIAQLETVMRRLVEAELDKHAERMRYYLAQARLAKARLYDSTLMNLNGAGERATRRGGRSQ